jgi:transposase
MEERLRFVARLLDGEGMSEVCREFGISRKTGYKIYNRYREIGLEALTDRARRPVRYANQLPHQVERLIVDLKRDKPHWGARKIRELLIRRLAGDVRVPARSTVHAVLDRHGLVARARRRRSRAWDTQWHSATMPLARGDPVTGKQPDPGQSQARFSSLSGEKPGYLTSTTRSARQNRRCAGCPYISLWAAEDSFRSLRRRRALVLAPR